MNRSIMKICVQSHYLHSLWDYRSHIDLDIHCSATESNRWKWIWFYFCSYSSISQVHNDRLENANEQKPIWTISISSWLWTKIIHSLNFEWNSKFCSFILLIRKYSWNRRATFQIKNERNAKFNFWKNVEKATTKSHLLHGSRLLDSIYPF